MYNIAYGILIDGTLMTFTGADTGVFGVSRPPPEIYQRNQKSDVMAYKQIYYFSFQHKTTYIFQEVAPTTPPTPYCICSKSCIRYDFDVIVTIITKSGLGEAHCVKSVRVMMYTAH